MALPITLFIHSYDIDRSVDPFGRQVPMPTIICLAQQEALFGKAGYAGLQRLTNDPTEAGRNQMPQTEAPAASLSPHTDPQAPFFVSLGFFETHRAYAHEEPCRTLGIVTAHGGISRS